MERERHFDVEVPDAFHEDVVPHKELAMEKLQQGCGRETVTYHVVCATTSFKTNINRASQLCMHHSFAKTTTSIAFYMDPMSSFFAT